MTQWRRKEKDQPYDEDEVKARLAAELPDWYYENGWIRRKYKTSGWKGTLMVINTVGHLGGVIVAGFILRQELQRALGVRSLRYRWNRLRMRNRLRAVRRDEFERRKRDDDDRPNFR